MLTVAISPSTFAELDKEPQALLKKAGVVVKENPFKRRLTEEEIIEHLKGVDGLIAGLEPLNRKVISQSPQLKAIARVGIGVANVDFDAAKEFDVQLTNTPDGPTKAVSELCLTVLMSILRNIGDANRDMHNGVWKKSIGRSINGLKVLIVGYGRIGRSFGDLLTFMGAEVYAYDPLASTIEGPAKQVSLAEGLALADVISLHASGEELILGEDEFALMEQAPVILNSARGELIAEEALIQALDKGLVGHAWCDVFSKEPYQGALVGRADVTLTPHISTYTKQCRKEMECQAVNNLLKDLGL